MKITTWNINSVRLRLSLIAQFVAQEQPDVLCLQETKCQDKEFPLKEIKALGFDHVGFKGQKSYNGVAIFSKTPLENVFSHAMAGKEDCRHICATTCGIELHNFYVPAGGDEPDTAVNDKFAHKLDFLAHMRKLAGAPQSKIIWLGDFNIAPHEHDVWSSKALAKTVSHTPIEREKLGEILTAGDFIDVARHLAQEDEKLYSWWSYRAKEWEVANKGRRLDHIWVSQALKPHLQALHFFKAARGWEKPSDHVPTTVELAL
jgi:exodeoxyribonuclease III